jgi:hypothetical protein
LQVPELTDGRIRPGLARLYYAYADALLDAGRQDEARDWFGRAASADVEEETDAAERYEELDGISIDDLGLDEEYPSGELPVNVDGAPVAGDEPEASP